MAWNTEEFNRLIYAAKGDEAKKYMEQEGAKIVKINLLGDNVPGFKVFEKYEAQETVLQGKDIKSLQFYLNEINTPEKMEALGKALQGSRVTSVSLWGLETTTPEKIDALRKALLSRVPELCLFGKKINTPEKMEALGKVLQGSQVSALALWQNEINTPKKIEALGKALQGSRVTMLALCQNEINNPEKIEAVGKALQGSQVSELALGWNEINTPEKIEAVGKALQGSRVSVLALWHNKINTPEKIDALGKALQGSRVLMLVLSGNGVEENPLLGFLRSLKLNSLIKSFNWAFSTKDTVSSLVELLDQNPQIMRLEVDPGSFSSAGWKEVEEVLTRNQNLVLATIPAKEAAQKDTDALEKEKMATPKEERSWQKKIEQEVDSHVRCVAP